MMHDVAIIGAGPAGMAAALQLTRYGINFIWLDKNPTATVSLLSNANCVENYLGLPGISGIDLLKLYKKHLQKYNIAPLLTEIQSLDYSFNKKCFEIQTDKQKINAVKRVIVASGTKSKIHPLIANLSSELKIKTGYEVIPFIKERNKTFAIIGAGDAAFDFALNLAKNNNIVHIFARSAPTALPVLVTEVKNSKNIFYHANVELSVIKAADNSSLKLDFEIASNSNVKNKEKYVIEVDYLIAAIGREPRKEFYSQSLSTSESDLINKNLLFLAGDVKNGIYRQTALATADGILAAMVIAKTIH